MGIILNGFVLAHVPRTGGSWRMRVISRLGNWQVYPPHAPPPDGLPVKVFRRAPASWLVSFANWGYDRPDLCPPWLQAGLERYGRDINRVCEALLTKPSWWVRRVMSLTASYIDRCGVHGFTARHILGYLDNSSVGPQTWLRRCVAGDGPTTYDMEDMHSVMVDLLAPMVGRRRVEECVGSVGKVNPSRYTLGRDLSPTVVDMVEELDA